jgi:nucleotide-binding universal stress UspA family protein
VLYASDQTDLDRSALNHLSRILPTENIHLHVLHVEQDPHEFLETLENCIPEGVNKNQVITKQVASENIVEGIRKYSVENKIDLIVMTRKTRKFWDTLFHSSVTNKMATYSEIPLLVFHEDEELMQSNRVMHSSQKSKQEVR